MRGVPAIRADAVHAAGITGKALESPSSTAASTDSTIRPRVSATHDSERQSSLQPERSVHVRERCAQTDRKGATLVRRESFQLGKHPWAWHARRGHRGGDGNGGKRLLYGVAPGANLIGIGTGDILFIFFALAGFDYILDHQQQYNIKVVNNSWGTSAPSIQKIRSTRRQRKVTSRGITVVFRPGMMVPPRTP